MTTLRDEFDNVLRREGKFDYVPWSSIADRLDDAAPGWSFAIMAIGPDWIHGRLTIGDQHFENVGYAENADAQWAKEVLKHAATDSFKRCAALAGVARYLYDKEADSSGNARSANHSPSRPPARPQATQRPVAVDSVPEEPDDFAKVFQAIEASRDFPPIGQPQNAVPTNHCPIHDVPWAGGPGDYWHKDPDGKYCRHPDNIKRSARRAS